MHTVPLSFALLTIVGYWRPVEWPKNSLKYWLYNVFSISTFVLLVIFSLWNSVAAIKSEDVSMLLDKLTLSFSILGVSGKIVNLFIRRGDLIRITNSLLQEVCIPRDQQEMFIQQKFNNFTRKLTVWCEILNEITVFFATIARISAFMKTRSLPLTTWVPYDLSNSFVYWISYIYQTLMLVICANTSVAHETLISGLMIETCAQLEILGHRFRNLPSLLLKAQKKCTSPEELRIIERKMISDYVRHHLEIYEFALNLNDIFSIVMFMQFSISAMVLALSVYGMSKTPLVSFKFAWGLFYLMSMLMQVFLYCWFGNEVTLKSMEMSNAVYEMDWTVLPVNVMKGLVIIIARCTRPIKISSCHILVFSAEAFTSIVKMSYSSFNLLKDSN